MKTLIATILLSLVCLTSQGQIKTNLWGLKLGESTEEQIINAMKNNRFKYDRTPDGFIISRPVLYGGERWNLATIHLFNGKLFAVVFVMNSQSNNYNTFLDLGDVLLEKYNQYENDFDVNDNEIYIQFVDENYISIKLCYDKKDNIVRLLYSDIYLVEQFRQQQRDRDL